MNELDADTEYLTTEQIVERFPALGSRWKVVKMLKEHAGPPVVLVRHRAFYKPDEVKAWLDNGGSEQRS